MAKKRKAPKKKAWIEWFDSQGDAEKRSIALACIDRLMESEEVSFYEAGSCDDLEDEPDSEGLIWQDCGEPIADDEIEEYD